MNIIYTLNDKFVPQVGAGICSVCENNQNFDEINFYIVSYGIKNENKKELTKLVKKYNRNIFIIELDSIEKYFDFEFDTTGWNPIVLARLLIDKLLPKKVDRVLYLDGDTIVRGNLKEFWNMNLNKKTIGMSIEPTIDKKRIKILDMENYPYCNAGVLLINLNRWRKINAGKTIINYYKSHEGKLFANDQDAINGAMKDEIKIISPKYNYYNIFDQYSYSFMCKLMKPLDYISKNTYMEARKNPVIIHYLGEERPWRKGNTHKYKKDYYKYLNMTAWKNSLQEDGWKIYFICWKIFNIITKPFPTIRYNIINSLIPKFMNYRANKLKKEKKEDLHTFVVLAYKESPYLEDCIKSVLNQKYKSKVVIATATLNNYIKNIADKYNLKIIENKSHKNIGGDFDFAISCGDTPLVTVAHQDDIYDYEYSYNIVENYKKNKDAIILFTDYYEIRNNEKVYKNTNLKIKRILLLPIKIFKGKKKFIKRSIIRFGNAICCPAVTFVKEKSGSKVFSCDFKCDVDWYAWEKLSLKKGSFVFVSKPLMGHRVHDESTTTEIIHDNIRTKEDLEMFKKFWPSFIAKALNKFYVKSEKSNNTKKTA